jgi:uncharacterized protein involved in exopolysaccharide biosynthesis
MKRIILSIFFAFLISATCFAQTKAKSAMANSAKSTPAFAELILLKTEVESTLEELLLDYKEEYPEVKKNRDELGFINKELDKLLKLDASQMPKLTLALGKLLVRKIELQSDLSSLRENYKEDNPEVVRAKKKLEIFEKAIAEIMQ